MECYWNNSNAVDSNTASNADRGHNGNFTASHAWEYSSWDLPTCTAAASASRPDLFYYPPPPPTAAAVSQVNSTVFQAAMFHEQEKNSSGGGGRSCTSLITSSTHYRNTDQHLTCLKLGKRHYFGDLAPPPPPPAPTEYYVTKKGKGSGGGAPAAVCLPRCQVEGCEAVLVNAKDYHRRHKVCEMHAKAPKVVLLGIEQRFCQQCSRFHAVGEFDEAKRSCRRRLAGHNERRRKSSQDHTSLAKKHHQYQDIKMVGAGRLPQQQLHLLNSSACALSLLSPASYGGAWNPYPSPDLPARCSAALRELIAENRASLFANGSQLGSGWVTTPENRGHVTLNLMQSPHSTFGLISGRDHRSSEEDGDGDCSELWKLPLGYSDC